MNSDIIAEATRLHDDGVAVNAKDFLQAYNESADIRLKQGTMKGLMVKKGHVYCTKLRAYKNLKLVAEVAAFT